MIFSQQKADDIEVLEMYYQILEVAVGFYVKTGNEDIKKKMEEIITGAELLQKKIETYDYPIRIKPTHRTHRNSSVRDGLPPVGTGDGLPEEKTG